ncbi:hypothetical protein BKA69DRAFT_482902 [Paraphysoderma sedebokerense]|nr:hypothetical protein BKA69DRAFT_482902 [Paraphysoderma sedebokerense]
MSSLSFAPFPSIPSGDTERINYTFEQLSAVNSNFKRLSATEENSGNLRNGRGTASTIETLQAAVCSRCNSMYITYHPLLTLRPLTACNECERIGSYGAKARLTLRPNDKNFQKLKDCVQALPWMKEDMKQFILNNEEAKFSSVSERMGEDDFVDVLVDYKSNTVEYVGHVPLLQYLEAHRLLQDGYISAFHITRQTDEDGNVNVFMVKDKRFAELSVDQLDNELSETELSAIRGLPVVICGGTEDDFKMFRLFGDTWSTIASKA